MQSVLVGAPDPEIVMLEAQLRAAQLTADVAALGALIADDLLFAGPDGQLVTKAQDLEAHAGGSCVSSRTIRSSCRSVVSGPM